jgi:nitrate reductase NapAB chaperone NapD
MFHQILNSNRSIFARGRFYGKMVVVQQAAHHKTYTRGSILKLTALAGVIGVSAVAYESTLDKK